MPGSRIPPAVLAVWAFVPFALFGAACVAGTSSTTEKAPTMTFTECQASAEYTTESGATGRYAVEFDNGVCIVQRP